MLIAKLPQWFLSRIQKEKRLLTSTTNANVHFTYLSIDKEFLIILTFIRSYNLCIYCECSLLHPEFEQF